MKRKQLWLALALGLVLVLLCAGSALAATDSLKFNMELSSTKFTEPKTITVSFTVTNASDSETPGPVTLCYPDGSKVEEFGEPVLSRGSSKNWSGPWSVTQEELDAGKITFIVRYFELDENGQPVERGVGVSKRIQYAGAAPEVEVSRSIVPMVAQEGQDVNVIYEITNKGPADLTGITIVENESISKESASVGSLKAGATVKHTFTVKMKKKDLTSAATVKYKAGGKSYTKKVEAAVIKFGKVDLTASLSADKKGGAPGDIVKLTLKLKNSGTTDFTNIEVTDEKLGTVFSGQTVKAGETLTLEKDMTVTETQELLFKVTGDDGAGGQVETATSPVKVIATDPRQTIALRVEATADREAVYQIPGGIVRFTVTVYNESAVDVENITVKAVDVNLYTFEKIPAGGSKYFTRDTEISMPGSFQFTANVKDQLGQTVSFPSNIIKIVKTDPPADPTPTPIVMPAKPAEITVPPQLEIIGDGKNVDLEALEASMDDFSENADPEMKDKVRSIASVYLDKEEGERLDRIDDIAGKLKWPLTFIAVVGLILLLIGAVRRINSKAQSAKAIDHLEGSTYRDYSIAPKGKKRNEVTSGDEEKPAAPAVPAEPQTAENTVQNSEPVTDTPQQSLYTPPAAENAVEAPVSAVEKVIAESREAMREAAVPAEAPAETPAEPVWPVQASHRRRSKAEPETPAQPVQSTREASRRRKTRT